MKVTYFPHVNGIITNEMLEFTNFEVIIQQTKLLKLLYSDKLQIFNVWNFLRLFSPFWKEQGLGRFNNDNYLVKL